MKIAGSVVILAALVAVTPCASAQEPDTSGRSAPVSPIGGGASAPEVSALMPGPAPALASINQPSIGRVLTPPTLFNPRFQILQTMDTNPGLQTGGDSLQGITYLSGGIAMSRRYRHQQMGLQYTGGG
ncbi:MAG TPA: hypothetical protein VG892_12835, partial [Terriglobales bacterium]|nr:hypothetical protein [Terriglobales bacterium]